MGHGVDARERHRQRRDVIHRAIPRPARLIRQPATDVVPLGRVDATAVGRLLAATGTSDVVDAHVVLCARRSGQRIVTSDPDDLRRLDPGVDLVLV